MMWKKRIHAASPPSVQVASVHSRKTVTNGVSERDQTGTPYEGKSWTLALQSLADFDTSAK